MGFSFKGILPENDAYYKAAILLVMLFNLFFFEMFLSHICYFAEKERERVGFGSPPSDSFLLSYFKVFSWWS